MTESGKIIGIDVGSISVKLALLLPQEEVQEFMRAVKGKDLFQDSSDMNIHKLDGYAILPLSCQRHQGEPDKILTRFLEELDPLIPKDQAGVVWVTGSGGKACSERWGFEYVNEFRAEAVGVGSLCPDVRTVFGMGGQTSKFIRLLRDRDGEIRIVDYETNGECAAGTGSFFDQQAERLRYRIEEVSGILSAAGRSASIAGRCSVFAKTDMIHAQQKGYNPAEILKGLCEAVVRNFKGNITKGKQVELKVALIGGVAANAGVVAAFKEIFGFHDGECIVPQSFAWMGAAGAALIGCREKKENVRVKPNLSKGMNPAVFPTSRPLSMKKVRLLRHISQPHPLPVKTETEAFLGIDVGSVSTNLALIDRDGDLIHGIYRMTEGRPVEAVIDSLKKMAAAVGDRVAVLGVGTTGSGRELIGLVAGADAVKDEITAHKTGAVHISKKYLDGRVDTIFEIGGQDSKFISLKDGVVVDFALNEACAAGTGSFLEEQSKQLGISIIGEFARLALRSESPLKLGERCTVFMEKELALYLRHGVPKEDIAAGLALSVVQNYLNRVVKKRKIGDVVFFQGGTAYNDGVAAAFATFLDREIVVPPHNGILGAIGAALLARDSMPDGTRSRFRGWDLSRTAMNFREFECQGCSNRCTIQEFEIGREKSFWGDKCSDRYRKRAKTSVKPSAPDLVRLRERLLEEFAEKHVRPSRGRVGFPAGLYYFDRLPFWKTYFATLGFETASSGPTSQKTVHDGVEAAVAEPCFPVQAVHGHLASFLNQNVEFIFLPNVINEEDPTHGCASFVCPWGQTAALVAMHSPVLAGIRDRIFSPTVHFMEGRLRVEEQLGKEMERWGVKKRENRRAVEAAYEAQALFKNRLAAEGGQVVRSLLSERSPAIILLGRPYNLYDPGINLNIPMKLRDLYGADVVPMDFLPVDSVDIRPVHDHMFWNYGRRILQAALFARDCSHFHLIYFSNFKCGPDSYIRHFVEEASRRPFLFLQMDSHSNDAGVMTRVEAFLESKKML